MADRLGTYRKKRDAHRTPEPVPEEGPLPRGESDTFVIQEHHARRLHWDFRLERDGVLVSWALPKGVLLDEPYARRQELLGGLGLAGPRWQTAPCFDDGDAVRTAAREQGLPGVVAKRLDGPYRQETADWRLISA